MVSPRRSLVAILALLSLLLAAAACSGGTAPAPAQSPQQPAAAAPTSAPAAAAPTSAPPAAAPAATSGEVRIGGIFNITGQNASQAVLWMKAADLAVKQINAAGGINGKKINLVKEDAQSSNPGALAALDKMIAQDNVVTILGPNLSTQIQAMNDTDKTAAIPFATGGTAVKNTQMGNPWILRLRPDDSIAAGAMVQYMNDEWKVKKVGIINDTDAFGHGGAEQVKEYAKAAGLPIVRQEEYTAGTKDYAAQLLNIKQAGADVIVVYATRPDDTAMIEKQYKDLGSPYKLMGDPGVASTDVINLAKDAALGLTAVVDYMPGVSEVGKKYMADYAKEYNGEVADTQAAYNYDAIYLFANAIKKVGEDRNKIREAILGIHGDWEGVCGTFDFTPNGDGLHSNAVIQIDQGGKYKFIKTVTVPAKKQ